MDTIAQRRPSVSPVIARRLIRAGLVATLAVAVVGSARLFDVSRECRGAFTSGFSTGFDIHRCKLTVKAVGTDLSVAIPLPR
jgi:hypothetical protein